MSSIVMTNSNNTTCRCISWPPAQCHRQRALLRSTRKTARCRYHQHQHRTIRSYLRTVDELKRRARPLHGVRAAPLGSATPPRSPSGAVRPHHGARAAPLDPTTEPECRSGATCRPVRPTGDAPGPADVRRSGLFRPCRLSGGVRPCYCSWCFFATSLICS